MVSRGTTTMDRELPVKLTGAEIQERGETIAAKMVRVKGLRKKRREEYRSLTSQIEAELDTVQTIAETIMSGVEARKQGDLFVGDQVVGADPNVPTTGEAAQALAQVAEVAGEVRAVFHKDGKICRKDPCKRRHLTAEQCRTNEIVPEGEAIGSVAQSDSASAEDAPPICAGCEVQLSALEIVKKLGLCETCQLAKPGDALADTHDVAEHDAAVEAATESAEETDSDDPRPRCSAGGEVLTAAEVEKALGLCQSCIDQAGGEDAEGGAPEAPAHA